MSEKKHILIVDDEPVWLKTMATILQRHGYDVKEAMSGADALQTLKVFEPDLIFLDVRMPGRSAGEQGRPPAGGFFQRKRAIGH